MAFSKRIKKIASLITSGASVLDIGCDHGLVDIYLTLYNNNKCVGSDITSSSIEMANLNNKKYKTNIEFIVSDGFKNINKKHFDVCIIAGMGSNTIIDIMSNSNNMDINEFVIQTNNDYFLLRKYMISKGYYITDEIALKDKKIWYLIIKFKKGYKKYSKFDLQFGSVLFKKQDDESKEYIKYVIKKHEDIYIGIPKKYIIKRFKIKRIIKKLKKFI